jgi:hypothetical protein
MKVGRTTAPDPQQLAEAIMRTRLLPFLVLAVALVPGMASAQMYRSYYTPSNFGNPTYRYYTPSNFGNPPFRNFGNPSATPIITAPNTPGWLNAGTTVPVNALSMLPGIPISNLGNALVNPAAAIIPAGPPVAGPQVGFPAGTPQTGAFVTPPTEESLTTPPAETSTPGVTTGGIPAGTPAVGTYGMSVNTSGYGISALAKTPTAPPFAPPSAATQPSSVGYPPTVKTTYAPPYAAPQVHSTFYAPLRRVYGSSNN